MRRRVDSKWWEVAVSWLGGGVEIGKKEKKKTVTRVRRSLRPYPPIVHTYIYMHYSIRSTGLSERETFRNALLYIPTDIYHIPLLCHFIHCNIYIYSQ